MPANLAPLPLANPPSLPELAYAHLREAILTGRLAADAPVRQEDVATQLGISRLPVREALRRLDAEGLVVLRPRRGYVVASLDRDEIDDVLTLQAVLEGQAGHAATVNRSAEVLADLEACLAQLDRITARSPVNVDQFAELNTRFHERLIESCGRPFLIRMLRLARANAERYTRAAAGMLFDLRDSQREHRRILEAYRAGDAVAVAKLCHAHRDATRKRLIAHLDRAGAQTSVATPKRSRRAKH